MSESTQFFLIFFTGLITMMNPLSAVPVFLSMTADRDEREKRRLLRKVARNIVLTLVVVLFVGSYILNFFGITIPALRIAGAILVINNGMGMVLNRERVSQRTLDKDTERVDISFAPLTMPFIVGPGTIAFTLGYADQISAIWTLDGLVSHSILIVGIILSALISYIVLRSSTYLTRLLGQSGIVAMTKIMGFIVLSIGIQLVLNVAKIILQQFSIVP